MNRPVNGLEVASKIVSDANVPKCWRDETIRSRENRNISNAPKM
jgi:hypothetical protein